VVEPTSPWQSFLQSIGDRSRELIDCDGATLARMDAAGRAAWPDVPLEPEAFAVHVAARMSAEPDPAAALHALHTADLFLACACARGLPAALASFERVHIARVPEFIARIDSNAVFADEVAQRLRETFLLPHSGRAPELASYSGRGALASWVRVVAVRTALRLKREQPGSSERADRNGTPPLGSPIDPGLDYLKLRYRSAYEQALRTSLEGLSDRDALLLKLHYVDGLSIDRIGAIYGMHRSTVARWRAKVRRALLESMREQVCRNLRLTESQFDSVAAAVRSQLLVSIRSALHRPAP